MKTMITFISMLFCASYIYAQTNYYTTTITFNATIPVSVYRKIETDFKNSISFTPTAEGKKLNYIYYWWSHEPQ